MSELSFMTSNKGGRLLIHNNFIYRRAKTVDVKTYWRCSTNNCKATLSTENDILRKTLSTQHNHTSHSNKIKRKKFYSELKRDVGRNFNVPVNKLYKAHVAKAQMNDEEALSYLPNFNTTKTIAYKARTSHKPRNSEENKLDTNGDPLDNKVIIKAHVAKAQLNDEEASSYLPSFGATKKTINRAKASHKLRNLDEIKIEPNEDSLNNTDSLSVSNCENDKILKMFPVGTKVISCEFSSEKNYIAELGLKCKSEEEFKLWLRDFENISGDTYRVTKTLPREGKVVLYKAAYSCHHNTYPNIHRVVKAPTKKHTDCAAKLNATVKAIVEGQRNRSQDTLRADYPTAILIRHNHNHDIDVVEAVENRGLEENVDPSWQPSLLLEKDQVQPEADGVKDFEKIESDTSMCNEHSDDEKPNWEEIELDAGVCGEQPDSDDRESGASVCDEQPDSDDRESAAGVCDEQPDSDDEVPKWEEAELIMKEITAIFKENFEESPKDFVNALSSMHKSIQTMKTADLLSAMHNFGKIQYKTITCQSLYNNQSFNKKENITCQSLYNNQSFNKKEKFLLETNPSLFKTSKVFAKSIFVVDQDYSV